MKFCPTNHKNSKKAKTIDHDVRYEIECCRPSDKQPDDILLPSDLQENKESEYIVKNKVQMLFFMQCQNK